MAGLTGLAGADRFADAAAEVGAVVMSPPSIDLPPSGHAETVRWRSVAGATGVRIGAASLGVRPTTSGSGRLVGVVAAGREKVTEILVDSPEPDAPLRALRIPRLKRFEGDRARSITGQEDLPAQHHLVLTPVVGGQRQAPIVAVPPLPRQRALPPRLVGGTLSGSVLRLPDVPGRRFRVTLVKGDAPEGFEEQTISHGDVQMYAAPMPVGLHVDGPDGAELFALGGAVTSPATVDLRAALLRHLGAAVQAGSGTGQVTATITLRSDVVGRASVALAVDGVVERAVPGRLAVEATGEPTAIRLPPPHPGRAAARTVADVTITHHGMALHPLSDAVPAADAGLGGPTVRDTPVVRRLPAGALQGLAITRVGVVGWPRGATDLRLEVLGATSAVAGLVPPADRQPPTAVWFDLEAPQHVDRPVEIALTATRGAFGWVAAPDPLVRIAVAVAPLGERVRVGGRTIELTGPETAVPGAVLAGTGMWDVVTDQLCTVALANAVLEFAP